MIKLKTFLFSALFALTATNLYGISEGLLFGRDEPVHIIVNNRVLAKVNGKAISVMDIMKKMDLLFYRQFPEYTDSVQARHQFYQANWKHVLQDLIDKELILSDAEENKLPVSNGDVRQEMESLFGPHIISNLDKIGMTYEQAWDIIKGDISIRRMMFYRVNTKAMRQVTPQVVKNTYDLFAKENIRPDQWTYNVVSIRNKDPIQGAKAAEFVHQLLTEKHTPLAELTVAIKDNENFDEKTSINVSEEYTHAEKDMAASYKEVLSTLKDGENSQPVTQKSRADNSTVFRIFYLKEMRPGGVIAFNEVENKIKDKLIDDAVGKESEAYLKKLREHFDVQDTLLKTLKDEDYQPFTLK